VKTVTKAMFNTNAKVEDEKRKYERFEVPIGVFVVLGPHSTKVGRVIDVSRSGLAFRHVDREEPLDGLRELDMFHIDNGFCLKKVPFEIIWDFENDESPVSFMRRRDSGVQFGKLTPKQRSHLKHFIQEHTMGAVI
jgi:hypothetical protein